MIKANVVLTAMYKNRSDLILGILIEAFVIHGTGVSSLRRGFCEGLANRV